MTYIPDCRTDENYNFDNLEKDNKEFVKGFDHCVDSAVKSFFYNLDVYMGDDDYLMHILNEKLPAHVKDGIEDDPEEPIETYGDLFRAHLLDWIEEQRDELITALIDGQSEKEEDKADE